MTIAWHLRGYDRRSELLGVEYDIGCEMVPMVRNTLPRTIDDPGMIDPMELTRDQSVRLAGDLGVPVNPDLFDYFVEADEDWRLVETIRDLLYTGA